MEEAEIGQTAPSRWIPSGSYGNVVTDAVYANGRVSLTPVHRGLTAIAWQHSDTLAARKTATIMANGHRTPRPLLFYLQVAIRFRAEVTFVEMMHTNESILSARGITITLRGDSNANKTSASVEASIRGKWHCKTYVLTGPK